MTDKTAADENTQRMKQLARILHDAMRLGELTADDQALGAHSDTTVLFDGHFDLEIVVEEFLRRQTQAL